MQSSGYGALQPQVPSLAIVHTSLPPHVSPPQPASQDAGTAQTQPVYDAGSILTGWHSAPEMQVPPHAG